MLVLSNNEIMFIWTRGEREGEREGGGREREREMMMMRYMYKIHYNTYKEREVGEEERLSYCNLSLGDGFFSFTLEDES